MNVRNIQSGPAATRGIHGHRTVVLATILTCQLMVVLDATIVNIALPEIRNALRFSPASLSWVVNAYTLTFGGLLLLGARSGDILGRRITFLAGVGLFTVASLAGGFSHNAAELLTARAIQGIGGALASPSSLALLMTMFSEGRERTRAIGYYSAVSVGGSAAGLLAGGLLTQYASWRWVLFVNVPIGIAVVISTYLFVPETPRHSGRFDLTGAVTSTVGMVALAYGFVHAATNGWSNAATVASFVVGVALTVAFVFTERIAASPITPLRLFANRNRATSYVARLLLVAGMMGMFFFLTQFLQEVLGYSPLKTGLAFLPITVMLFAATQLASRGLSERVGSRVLLLGGIGCSTLAMLWLTQLSAGSSYTAVLGPLVVFGAGNGLAFVPLTNASLSGVRPDDAGAASGLVNVMQQVGGSLGLAVLVTVFGSASRSVLSHPDGRHGVALAQHALAVGADHAFWVATGFLLATLGLVAAMVQTGTPPPAPPIDEELVGELGAVGAVTATASG